MYCKISTKANVRTERIAWVPGQKCWKYCALLTCWYSRTPNGQLVSTWLKNTTKNSGDISLINLGRPKTEELIWYCVYVLFVPTGTGHMLKDLEFVIFPDSLQSFSRWITALLGLRPSVKSKWSSFLSVYRYSLKLQDQRKTILFLHDLV